jgi:hypothetical protein
MSSDALNNPQPGDDLAGAEGALGERRAAGRVGGVVRTIDVPRLAAVPLRWIVEVSGDLPGVHWQHSDDVARADVSRPHLVVRREPRESEVNERVRFGLLDSVEHDVRRLL